MTKITPKISQKKKRKLEKQGKLRDEVEIWVDKHNHKMELLRTISNILNLVISTLVILRVYGII